MIPRDSACSPTQAANRAIEHCGWGKPPPELASMAAKMVATNSVCGWGKPPPAASRRPSSSSQHPRTRARNSISRARSVRPELPQAPVAHAKRGLRFLVVYNNSISLGLRISPELASPHQPRTCIKPAATPIRLHTRGFRSGGRRGRRGFGCGFGR